MKFWCNSTSCNKFSWSYMSIYHCQLLGKQRFQTVFFLLINITPQFTIKCLSITCGLAIKCCSWVVFRKRFGRIESDSNLIWIGLDSIQHLWSANRIWIEKIWFCPNWIEFESESIWFDSFEFWIKFEQFVIRSNQIRIWLNSIQFDSCGTLFASPKLLGS